jgi:hypothetical protein
MKDDIDTHGKKPEFIQTNVGETFPIQIVKSDNNERGISSLVRTIKQMDEEIWIRQAEAKNARRASTKS